MTRANAEQSKFVPWFAKAGAACSIVPIARFVTDHILLAASRGNPSIVLKDAASAYKVDTDAIAGKVKQEFTAKEKAKKTPQSAVKAAKKAA
jgi:hypothetical protein